MSERHSRKPGCIRVALDPATATQDLLRAAVHLAASLESRLEGLLIEDENLLRLANVPFARHVTRYGTIAEPPDQSGIEREIRLRTRKLQQLLAEMAEREQVEHTFRVVRGIVEREIRAAAAEADLIALWRAGRAIDRQARATSRTGILPLHLLHGRASRSGGDASLPNLISTEGAGLLLVNCQSPTIGEKLLHDLLSEAGSIIIIR